MIKTILVDDDVEMLEGLSNIIRWEDYGFTLVAKAKNGFEALNLITKLMPDMVVADITMPVMDGLELIREAKKFKPGLRSIIVSCHEEFEYAKMAIRLEADEYILKHTLTKESLIDVLRRQKEKIERQQSMILADRSLSINRYIIAEKLFSDFFEANILDEGEFLYRANVSSIKLPPGDFRFIGLYLDDPEETAPSRLIRETGAFVYAVLNIIEDSLGESVRYTLFSYRDSAFYAAVWNLEGGAPEAGALEAKLEEILESLHKVLNARFSACAGSLYGRTGELHSAKNEADSLRAAYFYCGHGLVTTSPREYKKPGEAEYRALSRIVRHASESLNSEHLSAGLSELFEFDFSQYEPAGVIKILNRLLIDMVMSFFKSAGKDASPGVDIGAHMIRIRGDLFSTCRTMFENAARSIAGKLRGRNITKNSEINKALQYIGEHLGEELGCENVASHVNLNVNYFSRVFKREMGVSFSEYLLTKRMNLATEYLMETMCPIEEIAGAIGIESVSYFYRAYKRITGNTPGDVRNYAKRKDRG